MHSVSEGRVATPCNAMCRNVKAHGLTCKAGSNVQCNMCRCFWQHFTKGKILISFKHDFCQENGGCQKQDCKFGHSMLGLKLRPEDFEFSSQSNHGLSVEQLAKTTGLCLDYSKVGFQSSVRKN